AILNNSRGKLIELGLDADNTIIDLTTKLSHITNGKPYSSYNLPVQNPNIISQCKSICRKNGYRWCAESDLSNQELVHRHSKRDRSSVINERLQALEKNK